MRRFEILLFFGNLTTFTLLAVPRLQTPSRMLLVVLVTALLAGIQIRMEGPRWQMIPAYALTVVFCLIWLLGLVIPGGIRVGRWIADVGVALGVLALAVSAVLPIALPVFHFPKPTGPYALGTLTYHWVDTRCPELFTPDPNDHRELMAQVWYPARKEPSAPRAPYIEDAGLVTSAIGRLLHLPEFVFSHLKYVTTNAVASAPVAEDQSSYPVLIYLTGVDGFRSASMFQIQELVSRGYIVVGLDQPGIAPLVHFPDGRQITGWPRDEIQPLIMQSVEPRTKAPALYGKALPDGIIPYFAQDVSLALDQLAQLNKSDPNHILTGRLNLEHAGTFGISLGGMNAAQACLADPRLKAGLIMDVWMPVDVVESGLRQPAMFIARDADTMHLEWSEEDIALTLTTMKAVYEGLPGAGYYVEIPKMFHNNFTDIPYWSPLLPLLGLTGPINAQRGFDLVNAYSLAFFDQHLSGQASSLLNGPSQHYPEVIFSSKRMGRNPLP